MPIDRNQKLAFCHVPRTGGVSICLALNLEIMDKHEPASWYRKHYPDYVLFATYRPHRDRVQSALGWGIDDSDAGLIMGRKRKPPTELKTGIKTYPNEYFLDCRVDYLLQYCDLEDELNRMLRDLNLIEVKLKRTNSYK